MTFFKDFRRKNKTKTTYERSFGISDSTTIQCCILGKFQKGNNILPSQISLFPPDLPGRTRSFPCSTTKLIIPERAVKLNHSCTCNAANVLESFKIKATLLINLYFYIPCNWKIQLKHYSDLLPENNCHSKDRIRRHPKQGSSKNGIHRERDSCSCFISVTGVVKGGLIQ